MNKNLGESVQNQDPARGPKALRVLIADDDQDSVLMLMMLIRAEGHAVRGVYAGRKVMEAVVALTRTWCSWTSRCRTSAAGK